MTAPGAGDPAVRVPARTCQTCGEYLPHWCAPVITIKRQRWTGRRIVTIADRIPAPVCGAVPVAAEGEYPAACADPPTVAYPAGRPAFASLVRDNLVGLARLAGGSRWLTRARQAMLADIDAAGQGWVWPLPNVWAGVSAGNQKWAAIRVPVLRQVPAVVRFISAEPLIGPITGLDLDGVHWVIASGESGPRHRPLDLAWARSLRDQCAAAGVAFWLKQVGGLTPRSGGDLLDGHRWKQLPPRPRPAP